MITLAAAAGSATWFLIEVGAILVGLALLARLASRSGFSPIPLYLLAGLGVGALSPSVISERTIHIEGQVAVVLLLFMLGLEYTALEVASSLRGNWRGGLADLLLNFSPGLLFGLLLGLGTVPAIVLGGVTYISSSGIVAKLLDDLDRLGNRETPAVLSILVIEDMAMIVFLPIVTALVAGAGGAGILVAVLVAGVLFAAAFTLAFRHGVSLSRRIHHASDEVVLLTVVGLLLVGGGLAEMVGVSSGVAAFLLGIAVSGQIADRARLLVAPLRDLFAAAFFVFFGMQVDLSSLPSVLPAALGLAVVTIATKVVTGWVATRPQSSVEGRLRAGTALVARGEFSIVIAGLAVTAGIGGELGALAAAYVLLTAIAGPLLAVYSTPLTRLVRRR